ncbi:iron ABC transporter permease [bacterium]|nr:iron ABC transporter permease [bacterium]MBU4602732.1 iron ABC transporter permease [bacterium]
MSKIKKNLLNKVNEIRRLINEPFLLLIIILVGLSLILFILFPLFKVIQLSFLPDEHLSLDIYKYIFQHRWLAKTFFNSMLLGVIVASLATLIGFIFAFALNRTDISSKPFFKTLAMLPIISPPFMLALSVILLLGRNGIITKHILGLTNFNIYGLKGLVLVQTMGYFPIAYLVLNGILQSINPELEDSAMNLGASWSSVFSSVTLPLSVPGIASAWLLVFVTSLADFANPMVLSGRFDVLSVQAYLQFTGMFNMSLGSALAILLLVPSMIAFLFQKYWVGKKSYITVTGKPYTPRDFKVGRPVKYFITFFCGLISVTVLLFYIIVIMGSFFKLWGLNYSLTLDHFKYSWDVGLKTIKDTVTLSAIATPFTGILAMIVAFLVVRKNFIGKKSMEFVSMLSFAVPGTVVGIGYILAFNKPPFSLTGTGLILVICFIFRNMPVGIESGVAALSQIDPAIEEAATNLGADSPHTFKDITLPLIQPAFFAGLSYSFIRCMTAVSAIIFLVSARWNHLTILILSETEIMRLGPACVLCTVLIVIVLVAISLIRKFTEKGPTTTFG